MPLINVWNEQKEQGSIFFFNFEAGAGAGSRSVKPATALHHCINETYRSHSNIRPPNRPDVVMGVLLRSVHLLHSSLQADPEAAPLLELPHLGHDDLKVGPDHLAPILQRRSDFLFFLKKNCESLMTSELHEVELWHNRSSQQKNQINLECQTRVFSTQNDAT